MNRGMLALACLVFCGCAGRMNTDLLQARIREQAMQLAETQREIAKTRSELKQSRLETERLKSELGQNGEPVSRSPVQISKLHIYPLASGGINKDDQPGDDAIVVQFAPFDVDNEPIKQPGQLEFIVLDPQLPESEQEVGRWSFSAEECRDHWTRGLTSSGFQFTLPLEQSAQHTDLVVNLQYKTNDERYDTRQRVKVAIPSGTATVQDQRPRKKFVQVVDDSDQSLPPVGDADSQSADEDVAEWAREEGKKRPTPAGHTVFHSSNWTDSTTPVLR